MRERLIRISFAIALPVIAMVLNSIAAFAVAPPLKIDYKTTDNERITAYMPFVYGMADKKMEQSINDLLLKDLENTSNNWNKSWQEMYNATQPEIRKGLHLWLMFQQNMNKNNILSMTLSEYSFTGGAHGMYFQYARNIDVLTGKDIPIDSLFKQNVDWKGMINSFVKEDIARYKRELKFTGISNNQPYYISNEGLVVFFNPYEIGTWADGTIEFVIPFRIVSFAFNENYADRLY